MIETLGQALGKVPKVLILPEQPGDVRLTCADISRASAELGYAPRTSFRDGIEAFVAWYRASR
jgi:UDP-glucuronate 4-epimerase